MLTFHKIRYRNFLSTGNAFTEVDFQEARTTLVIGKNGGGKSTLIDALHFALYGTAFRKINKPQLMNSINRKDLLVELEFSVGRYRYKIRRGIKPSVFEVFQGENLINQNAESKEYQDVLEQNIIKMSARTFSQIVVLGSRSYTPFMRLTTPQRREIIEDLLDIKMFSVMNVLLKEKISENKIKLQDAQSLMRSLGTEIEMLQQHLNSLKKNRDELISQRQEQLTLQKQKVDALRADLTSATRQIQQLIISVEDADQVSSQEEKYRQLLAKIQVKVERLAREIEFYSDHDSCPTCKQGIAHEHKTGIVQKDNTQLQECNLGVEQLNGKLTELATRQREIRVSMDGIRNWQKTQHGIGVEIRMVEDTIKDIQGEIDKLSGTEDKGTESVQFELKVKKGLLRNSVSEVNELGEEKQIFDVVSVLLKDTGIKTKIIRQYIPVINKLINKYLSSLDFFVNFELNDSFEEIIKSRHRDEFTYASFSEGEKARLDIAILFTWRAVAKLRNSASTNLLILDEVFDGSLDAFGNDNLITILNELAGDSNIFVISHKIDSGAEHFEKTIKFEKVKNFSEMSIV